MTGFERMTAGMAQVGAAPAAPVKAGYRRSVDLARIVAAFGIVWDHARAPYADEGYLALALFLVLTSFLAVGSFERSDGKGFWWSRVQRIALPWLFWCAVYRVVLEVISHGTHPLPLLTEPGSLLIGPFIHLWFLPFVMLALPVIPLISRSISDERGLIVASLLLIAVSIPLGMLHAEVLHPGILPFGPDSLPALFAQPLPQWFFALPLFLFGALLAVSRRTGGAWVPMAAAAVVSGVLYLVSPEFASVQMILVAVVFEVVWRIEIKGSWPTWAAGFAFGIYVMHPIFMLVAFKLFGADVDRSLGALFTFGAAWGATALMQRLPIVNRFA